MASADAPQPPPHQADHTGLAPLLCRDPLSATTVFLAPARGGRPIEFADGDRSAEEQPVHVSCPFCRGHENLAPPSVVSLPPGGRWQARIVPNRYPIVGDSRTAAVAGEAQPPGAPLRRAAVGVHDVLIESPEHDTRVEAIDAKTWGIAWQAAHQRLTALAKHPPLRWAMLFKNAGPKAGASLAHVHSQIVGLDFVPPMIQHKGAMLREQPGLHERVLADAEREGRIWAEDKGLVAFVPSAARQPFETCIMPRSPEPRFHLAPAASVAAIARLTQRYARRLAELASGGNYNWWLHQAPFDDHDATAGWHWHLEIMPRLTQLAGFELGTGCHITTMPPHEAAKLLQGS